MEQITVAVHTIVLLHTLSMASVSAQYLQQMPYAQQMQQHMPSLGGMIPQSVQTLTGQGLSMPMMPGGMSMNMMPGGMGMNQKMPVVVMPYHSKAQDKKNPRSGKNRKKKKHRSQKKVYKSESCSSEESSASDETESSGEKRSRKRYMRKSKDHKRKRRGEVLTPVISYVTKDGYVVYQKKVQKEKAKDWLDIGHKSKSKHSGEESSNEKEHSNEKKADVKRKYKKSKKYD